MGLADFTTPKAFPEFLLEGRGSTKEASLQCQSEREIIIILPHNLLSWWVNQVHPLLWVNWINSTCRTTTFFHYFSFEKSVCLCLVCVWKIQGAVSCRAEETCVPMAMVFGQSDDSQFLIRVVKVSTPATLCPADSLTLEECGSRERELCFLVAVDFRWSMKDWIWCGA